MLKCTVVKENFSLAQGDVFNCDGAVRIYQRITTDYSTLICVKILKNKYLDRGYSLASKR